MMSFPVVSRELIAAARRPSTYWTRLGAGASGLGVCVLAFASAAKIGNAAASENLFEAFTAVMLVYCYLAGLLAADSLSSEKREGTLGLLFLTDLRGRDVVLGKLAATSLNAAYGVVSVIPILAVCFLFGGLDLSRFCVVFLCALNLLFLSLGAALFSSSVCVSARRAAGLALVILVLLVLLPVAIAYFVFEALGLSPEWILRCSPVWTIQLVSDYGHRFSPAFRLTGFMGFFRLVLDYAPSFAIVHALGWILFLAACRRAPRSWQTREPSRRWVMASEWERRFVEGATAAKLAWRRECLGRNAYFWLAGRERHRGRLPWIFIASIFLIWLMGWWNTGLDSYWLRPWTSMVYVLLLQGFVKAWFAVQASQQFIEDRRCGALELLLTSPLSAVEIVSGQWEALRTQFLRPVAAIVLLEVALVLSVEIFGERGVSHWVIIGVVNIILIPLDFWALGGAAMAGTLSAARYQSAALVSIAPVLLGPWLVILVFRNADYGLNAGIMALPWLALCSAVDLAVGWRARARLFRDFRSSASARYSGKAGSRGLWRALRSLRMGDRGLGETAGGKSGGKTGELDVGSEYET